MIRRCCLLVVLMMLLNAVAMPAHAAGERPLSDLSPEHPEVIRAKEQAARRVDRAEALLASAKQSFQKVQSELRDITGRIDVAPESLRKAASRLESELESLQLDAAGCTARTEALERTIQDVVARGLDAAKRDEVAAEYAIVVASRQAALKNAEALVAQGGISNQELENARAAFAEAKARLLERRNMAATAAGGGALADWNRELLNLSLDAQERRARMKYLSQSLDRIRQGLPMLDQLQELEEALPAARRAAAEARRAMDDLDRELLGGPSPAPAPQARPQSKDDAPAKHRP
jgi:chromosome segregation ATPase